MPRFKHAFLTTASMLLCFSFASVSAQQATLPVAGDAQVVKISARRTSVELIEKFAKVIQLNDKMLRVDGFDQSVVNVKTLSAWQLHIQSVAQGFTTIALTDTNDKTYYVDVFVKGDARHLQAIIDNKFPNSSVEALKVRESVVLRGWVSQPEHINQIVEISEQFYPDVLNQMKVGGVQQVALKVKIMEVQRAKIRQFGFNFLYGARTGYLSGTPGQIVQLGEVAIPFANNGSPSVSFLSDSISGATMSFALTHDDRILNGFIEALKEESLLKIMAEPEVVTTNGRPATLLSGGEFPILVPQSLGTVTIEWRKFGVRLEAVPIILGDGQLRLELQPEVSERDFTNAVDLGGTTVPGLTTRRVNTQVEMRFGQTLMIGGLIASRQTAETDKVPLLGELPIIGAAFNRKRYDDVETELVVMVTPELVAPLEPNQVPPGGPGSHTTVPNDRELYIDGLLEVPKSGDDCATCGPSYPGHSIDSFNPSVPGLKSIAPVAESPAIQPRRTENPQTGPTIPALPTSVKTQRPLATFIPSQRGVRRGTTKRPIPPKSSIVPQSQTRSRSQTTSRPSVQQTTYRRPTNSTPQTQLSTPPFKRRATTISKKSVKTPTVQRKPKRPGLIRPTR
ncbi:MAG: hypothetical protein CMJ78_21935 [Planctomycetaceae bacterium]|nr:hypothetical protein [Planctomycetaceae bacterium]